VASVHISPSDGNIYKYMLCAFKYIYSISHIATFLAKKKIAMTCGLILVFTTCNLLSLDCGTNLMNEIFGLKF
jgi:hypothetical protein